MNKFQPIDLVILFPPLIFLLLTYPYFGQAPSLDPMGMYRESGQFFYSGIKEIIENGVKIHPPLLYTLNSIFFWLFGKNPFSYNLLGFLVFVVSEVTVYFTTRHAFGSKVAVAFTLLLFSNPLIIINSFYLANDMLIVLGLSLALCGYILNKKLLLAGIFCLMVLMKETALVVVLTFFLVMEARAIFDHPTWSKRVNAALETALVFFPALVVYLAWFSYLRLLGTTEWQDTIFTHTNDNSFVLVLKNIFSLKFLNVFLFQNMRNALTLNFQWIYVLLTVILAALPKTPLMQTDRQKHYFYAVLAIGLAYTLLALSFPTWTVPRYTLPVVFCLFFFLALLLGRLRWPGLPWLILPSLLLLMFFSNIFSFDPISSRDGFITVGGEKFYNIPFWNSGPDRIIYNTQFLQATKKQNDFIKKILNQDVDTLITYCDELKLGEKIWSISVHNEFYPDLPLRKPLVCINDYDLKTASARGKLKGKILQTTATY